MIAGLLAPIGVILLFNIVIFTLVVRQFVKRTSKNSFQRTSSNMSKRKKHKQRLQNALTVMTLMGLTWSIGYLNVVRNTFTVQLVFCLLNTMQGYFIFILYGVRQNDVRRHWKHCCVIQRERFSSVRTSSENANSSTRPTLQSPFNPNQIPEPSKQIYRHRPASTMPPL